MSELTRVLYIDDSAADRDLVCDALEMEHGGFEVFLADSRKALEALLSQGEYDVVLSDFNILGFEGLDVIDLVRKKDPAVPVIIVTGTGSELIAVESMKRGAADYVVKSHKQIQRLPLTIQAVLEKVQLRAEKKKQEAIRRASDEKYQIIFNASHDAILIIDPTQNHFLEVNAVACTMLGFTRQELLSVSVAEIHPNEMDTLEDFIQSVAEKSGELKGEFNCRTKTGVYIPVEISASVMNFNGKPCILAVARDITGQKDSQAQQRLAASVFKNTTEGIMVTDTDKTIISVNPAFTRITGFTADEAIGQNPRIFKSGRHDQTFYRTMLETVGTQGHWEGEIWDRRKSGEIYPKWLSITTIKDGKGHVLRYIGLFSDITKRKEDEKELHLRAYYDPLTRLPNRTFAFERLSEIIKQDKRYERRGALFFVDLDHFKQINDTLGHIIGDTVLVKTADRLRAAVRETDTVARTGGDEFLIILPEVSDLREVRIVADKILEILSRPFQIEGRDLFLGASIGITMIPDDGEESTILLKNADMAMYRAKAKGRNNYQFFNKEMEKTDKARTLLEWDLRQALANRELVLHYQPIINLCTLKTVSLEALVRWHHPHHGLISPERFIPLAEQSGLISKISKWVLSTACTQVKLWQERYGLEINIAVNLSTRDFRYSEILTSITEILKRSGLSAESLIIEITESLMLDPNEEALEKLEGIKKMGVRIAIDDFGTGYSSLSYLSRYPIDFLKIDKSFIQSLDSDSQKKALVEAMIKMGQSMGMEVIAEGVETAEELSYLRKLGCDKVQGFYFSKALSAKAYEAVLEKQ